MSKIEVNTVDVQCGSTLTLGSSGKTVKIATGASTCGMGRTGTVDWCSTVYTNSPGTITSVNGKGYFINTTSGAVTVTLPASPSAGDIIAVKDYARTFASNKVTLSRNGSKMCGACANTILNANGQSITLIYVDSTKGWTFINDDTVTQGGAEYVTATGGTETTCGDYKIHTFNADANFVVSNGGNSAGSNKVSYVVVAGGGGGGGENATTTSSGGGGAGGYREGKVSTDSYSASPLAATPCSGLTLTAQTYPITVGGGGAGGPGPAGPNNGDGTVGANSVFSTITSAGGGYGSGRNNTPYAAGSGGSGGGAKQGNQAGPATGAGVGNTPPVSPPQGNNGGVSDYGGPTYLAGGGGGAGAVGGNPTSPGSTTGPGGAGVTSSITASAVARSGGGGAGKSAYPGETRNVGTGGTGGGGAGAPGPGVDPSQAGTANTGGGGGGGAGKANPSISCGGAGGSGVVIIRYKYQ
jgi:hypothetical protein